MSSQDNKEILARGQDGAMVIQPPTARGEDNNRNQTSLLEDMYNMDNNNPQSIADADAGYRSNAVGPSHGTNEMNTDDVYSPPINQSEAYSPPMTPPQLKWRGEHGDTRSRSRD